MSRWILLRGLMRERRHWGEFPATLARTLRLADGTIVTPDLPGNGGLHRAASAATVAGMVAFCRADLLARGLPPPYHVLALSLGGMVAVEWASRYPDEIAGCVLINTSMRPFSRFYQRLRWRNYPALMRQLLRGDAATQEQLILRLTSRDDHSALLARWVAWQREHPVSRANALRQLWSAARFRGPSVRPSVPLLVLAGAGDRLVDHRCSLRLARAWDAPLRLHPDAGHDLPLDDGEWVARQVGQWLREKEGL